MRVTYTHYFLQGLVDRLAGISKDAQAQAHDWGRRPTAVELARYTPEQRQAINAQWDARERRERGGALSRFGDTFRGREGREAAAWRRQIGPKSDAERRADDEVTRTNHLMPGDTVRNANTRINAQAQRIMSQRPYHAAGVPATIPQPAGGVASPETIEAQMPAAPAPARSTPETWARANAESFARIRNNPAMLSNMADPAYREKVRARYPGFVERYDALFGAPAPVPEAPAPAPSAPVAAPPAAPAPVPAAPAAAAPAAAAPAPPPPVTAAAPAAAPSPVPTAPAPVPASAAPVRSLADYRYGAPVPGAKPLSVVSAPAGARAEQQAPAAPAPAAPPRFAPATGMYNETSLFGGIDARAIANMAGGISHAVNAYQSTKPIPFNKRVYANNPASLYGKAPVAGPAPAPAPVAAAGPALGPVAGAPAPAAPKPAAPPKPA